MILYLINCVAAISVPHYTLLHRFGTVAQLKPIV